MTKRIAAKKPSKPRKDFPLFPHSCGQWAKKVHNVVRYFGAWEDPDAAEALWDRQKRDLLEGKEPSEFQNDGTVGWLCNRWMQDNHNKVTGEEMSQRCFDDYWAIAKHVTKHFGKHRSLESIRATDFVDYRNALPSHWAPTTTNSHLRRVRVLFSYGNNIEATERPFAYKLGLKDVPKVKVRKHQAKQARKEFSKEECMLLIDNANVMMKAYIHLALNCGYGPADIGRLEHAQVDLESGWLGEPRGKTGLDRGAWLWPETIEAVQEAIDKRVRTINPEKDKLAFLTQQRRPVYVDGRGKSQPIVLAFGKLKKAVGIDRKGCGFYSLRHVCATIGGDAGDQTALNYIMGHADASIQNNYREGVDPERVKAVCDHTRSWLYG